MSVSYSFNGALGMIYTIEELGGSTVQITYASEAVKVNKTLPTSLVVAKLKNHEGYFVCLLKKTTGEANDESAGDWVGFDKNSTRFVIKFTLSEALGTDDRIYVFIVYNGTTVVPYYCGHFYDSSIQDDRTPWRLIGYPLGSFSGVLDVARPLPTSTDAVSNYSCMVVSTDGSTAYPPMISIDESRFVYPSGTVGGKTTRNIIVRMIPADKLSYDEGTKVTTITSSDDGSTMYRNMYVATTKSTFDLVIDATPSVADAVLQIENMNTSGDLYVYNYQQLSSEKASTIESINNGVIDFTDNVATNNPPTIEPPNSESVVYVNIAIEEQHNTAATDPLNNVSSLLSIQRNLQKIYTLLNSIVIEGNDGANHIAAGDMSEMARAKITLMLR